MRRMIMPLASVLVFATAFIFAADIPERPEELQYPEFKFDLPDADSLRFELADGTPVYAKRDSEFPLVNITVYFKGGRYLESDDKAGLAAIAGDAWRSGGAGERTAQELDEDLDFLAATIGTNIGEVSGSASLNVLSKDLDEALAIFMDVLTKPTFQQDRFDKTKDNMIQAIKQRNDDSANIEGREWRRLINGDDFWGNRLSTKASIDSITTSDAKGFVSSLVRSGNVLVAVSGDFEAAAMEALLNRTIGSLEPMAQPLPAIPQPDHTPAPGVYVVNKSDVNQGRVRIGKIGFREGHPDEFALKMGNEILGGGGFTARMMKRIRSDEGLAYDARSSLNFPVTIPGAFVAEYQSKSSTVPYAAEIFFELLDSMRTKAASDEELQTAKVSFIEIFPRFFASADQIVGIFASDELLGRDHSYWTDYRDRVAAVSAKDVTAAMKKHLDPATMIMLVVGNLEEISQGHPDHEAALTDFGEIKMVPLRDPLTLEPIVE